MAGGEAAASVGQTAGPSALPVPQPAHPPPTTTGVGRGRGKRKAADNKVRICRLCGKVVEWYQIC